MLTAKEPIGNHGEAYFSISSLLVLVTDELHVSRRHESEQAGKINSLLPVWG